MRAEASPNIAFIKYWGKKTAASDHDKNLALNPSISMTLSKARSSTRVTRLGPSQGTSEVFLNGQAASPQDFNKITAHLKRVTEFLQLAPSEFRVESDNNFPLGTGLASSASGFAALTLAAFGELLGFEKAADFQQKGLAQLSALARRGSGSACRSVMGPYCKWEGTHATPLAIKEWKLYDTILIFSRDPKKVSSTDAHAAIINSPLLAPRLRALPERTRRVEDALRAQDLHKLGPLLEREALDMHAVAHAATPSIDYLLPETRTLIRAFQEEDPRHREFFFTLDAGPNLHLISERPITDKIKKLLATHKLEQVEIWEDECGTGPLLFHPLFESR